MNALSITRLRDQLYKYSRSLGCIHADAEDLTQDVFVSLIKNGLVSMLDETENTAEALRNYAYKVARNHFIDQTRRAHALKRGCMAVHQSLDVDDQSHVEVAIDAVTPSDIAEQREVLESWERCVAQLAGCAEQAGKGTLFRQASPFLAPGSRCQYPGNSANSRVQIFRWRRTLLAQVRADLAIAQAA